MDSDNELLDEDSYLNYRENYSIVKKDLNFRAAGKDGSKEKWKPKVQQLETDQKSGGIG